jgi:hypothetical protein
MSLLPSEAFRRYDEISDPLYAVVGEHRTLYE